MNLAKFYDLSGKDLGDILGISGSGVTRLNQGQKFIFPDTKEGWICIAKKDVIEFTRLEILKKERLSFSIEDYALE